MDIRTKLVFALVAVMFGSMFAFGAFMYRTASRMIDEGTEEQLAGLAESNADALGSIVHGWEERVLLIASRTQLRISLREYRESGNPEELDRIQRILSDATGSVTSVAALAVYDDRGRPIAQVGVPVDSIDASLAPTFSPQSAGDVHFLAAAVTDEGFPRVGYTTPLVLDGERIGYLLAVLNGRRILDLTDDTTGLGTTGEVMIVAEDPEGARTLHPVRHPIEGQERRGAMVLGGEDDPALLALQAFDDVETEGLVDYRDQQVWAATRFVPETKWGVVVKFDEAEKRASIYHFREELVALALALAGIGFLVAVFLGFRFAAPIHNLAEAANRIREGDLDARAEVVRQDEIGLLARTFNHMAEDLQVQVTELHEFRKFFDVSLDMLCIAGTDGYFKRTNPAFVEVLGWSRDELASKPFLDLVHPDDVQATQEEIGKLSQGIPTISFVNRFRCLDGTWKWLRWNSYPDPDTRLLYAVAREIRGPEEA